MQLFSPRWIFVVTLEIKIPLNVAIVFILLGLTVPAESAIQAPCGLPYYMRLNWLLG